MPSFFQINPAQATRRRVIFVLCNLFFVGLGAFLLAQCLPQTGWTVIRAIVFALFILLLAQVIYGFMVSVAGWWLLRHGSDSPRINETLPPEAVPNTLPATAIVMPIFNEDVGRVFQGLRVMYESLQKTKNGEAFDFFILSDSSDVNIWIAEEKAWFELCKLVQGFGRIFYRKRRVALHYKSGNIADFCRRWGASYRYMIVLDADSVMTGKSLVRLAALMEQNPSAGIIQSSPRLVLGQSLFQRIHQFANRAYGPMFAAGANIWQLDTANFWGHNAIIRIKPFMKFCAMPELPKTGPLGTRIFSHDTVEAAFMRRSGYEVWSAYDMEGTYEEAPPHLLASLQRERRWCHGNLQHLWLIFAPGLTASSRFNIFLGIMSYANAPLWFLFMLLNCISFAGVAGPKQEIINGVLFAVVMFLLLVPKFLGAMLLTRRPEKCQAHGGRRKILASMVAETISSMIMAPILMLFYTRFVWSSFTGASMTWGRQKRADQDGPSWSDWVAIHGTHTILALACTILVAWLQPWFLPWLVPVLFGPIFAIPFSRIMASNMLGQRAREHGWFLVPEEKQPSLELQQLDESFTAPPGKFFRAKEYVADYGLLQAALDPYVNSIHVNLLRQRPQTNIRTREYLIALGDRLLLDGPFGLTLFEKRILLWDADAMLTLHQKLWSSSATYLHEWWQTAFRQYNQTSAQAGRRRVNAL